MFKEIPSNVVFLSGMLGTRKTELKKKIAEECGTSVCNNREGGVLLRATVSDLSK